MYYVQMIRAKALRPYRVYQMFIIQISSIFESRITNHESRIWIATVGHLHDLTDASLRLLDLDFVSITQWHAHVCKPITLFVIASHKRSNLSSIFESRITNHGSRIWIATVGHLHDLTDASLRLLDLDFVSITQWHYYESHVLTWRCIMFKWYGRRPFAPTECIKCL